jgi:hypothetical protein
MAGTLFGNAIDFLIEIGFYDVVLPFLLVFTVFFGVLEKTKIFGTEDGTTMPKKNLNAMVAFVVAFFVISAKEIVTSIQESLPLVALVLLAIISFLLLIGSMFSGEKEFNFMDLFEGWRAPFAGVFLVSIVLIFFQSFGWLNPIWEYFTGIGTETFILVVFLLAVVGIMFYVVGGGAKKNKGDDD